MRKVALLAVLLAVVMAVTLAPNRRGQDNPVKITLTAQQLETVNKAAGKAVTLTLTAAQKNVIAGKYADCKVSTVTVSTTHVWEGDALSLVPTVDRVSMNPQPSP